MKKKVVDMWKFIGELQAQGVDTSNLEESVSVMIAGWGTSECNNRQGVTILGHKKKPQLWENSKG